MKKLNTNYDDLSKLIISAIEDEQFFDKQKLIPKVRAILSGFKANVNNTKYNKIESPSDAARRLRSIEYLNSERDFWKNKVKEAFADKMNEFYAELDVYNTEKGFIKINIKNT